MVSNCSEAGTGLEGEAGSLLPLDILIIVAELSSHLTKRKEIK